MNLYQMTDNVKILYQMLEDGEIDEELVQETIEAMCVPEKLEDYCKVIRQFEADAAAYKAEKDFFAGKQKSAEKTVERLTKALKSYMMAAGKTEEKAGVFALKVSQSKAVNILDAGSLSLEYLKPQPPEVDKAAIRKVLMAGGEVAGAELVINTKVSIK